MRHIFIPIEECIHVIAGALCVIALCQVWGVVVSVLGMIRGKWGGLGRKWGERASDNMMKQQEMPLFYDENCAEFMNKAQKGSSAHRMDKSNSKQI